MPNIVLKIEGLEDLVSDVHKAGKQMETLLYGAMVKATTLVQEEAKRVKNGSFQNRTGNLRRSITRRVDSLSRGRVFTDSSYAPVVEEGSRPHTILPSKKRMLAFKINGKMVFARKVNHPGSRPYPFMRPALEQNVRQIGDFYDQVAKEVVSIMGR